ASGALECADTSALLKRRHVAAVQTHRQTPRAPIAALLFKSADNFVTTRSTSAIFKIPFTKLVPIAFDEKLAATGTPCAASLAIMHVAGVNVVQPFRASDLAGTSECGRGRVWFIEHFEIRVERCEMPRHLGPEIFHEPFRCAMQLVIAVVL